MDYDVYVLRRATGLWDWIGICQQWDWAHDRALEYKQERVRIASGRPLLFEGPGIYVPTREPEPKVVLPDYRVYIKDAFGNRSRLAIVACLKGWKPEYAEPMIAYLRRTFAEVERIDAPYLNLSWDLRGGWEPRVLYSPNALGEVFIEPEGLR